VICPNNQARCVHVSNCAAGHNLPGRAGAARAGVTANPNDAWVTQQARNLLLVLGERGRRLRHLLRDHHTRFSRGFDDVVRDECLDWLPIVGAATSSKSFGSTSDTTTSTVHTGRWSLKRQTRPPD
jgi:hypothetical protein